MVKYQSRFSKNNRAYWECRTCRHSPGHRITWGVDPTTSFDHLKRMISRWDLYDLKGSLAWRLQCGFSLFKLLFFHTETIEAIFPYTFCLFCLMVFHVTLVILAMANNGDMSFEVAASTVGFWESHRTGNQEPNPWEKNQQSTHGKLVVWIGTLRFSGYPNFCNNPVHKGISGIQTTN